MSAEHTLEQIRKYIEQNYDHTENGQGFWETGNFDDTFEMGIEAGRADALFVIGTTFLGMDLKDKEPYSFE